MNRKLLIKSLIIITIFIGGTIMPIINVTCGNTNSADYVPMCYLRTIEQVSFQLDGFRQQTMAILAKTFSNLLFINLLIISLVMITVINFIFSKININLLVNKNISPWDSLKLAMAKGIVHNKIFQTG